MTVGGDGEPTTGDASFFPLSLTDAPILRDLIGGV